MGDYQGKIERLVNEVMKCPTGKTTFETEDLAKEALIQNHIRNNYRSGSGPLDIYVCPDCGDWHFTSRPPAASWLLDPETISRIEKERRAFNWEQQMK